MTDPGISNGTLAVLAGIVSSFLAWFSFINIFQTKAGCTKSHNAYEETQQERIKTQKAELRTVIVQQNAIHSEVKEIKELVNKIASAVYVPRGSERTRATD